MTRKEEIEEMASLFSLQHKVLEDFGEKLTFQEIAEDSFKCGAEWADKTMLDKVYDFIIANVYKYGKVKFVDNRATFDFRMNTFLNDLKQAMEE